MIITDQTKQWCEKKKHRALAFKEIRLSYLVATLKADPKTVCSLSRQMRTHLCLCISDSAPGTNGAPGADGKDATLFGGTAPAVLEDSVTAQIQFGQVQILFTQDTVEPLKLGTENLAVDNTGEPAPV